MADLFNKQHRSLPLLFVALLPISSVTVLVTSFGNGFIVADGWDELKFSKDITFLENERSIRKTG